MAVRKLVEVNESFASKHPVHPTRQRKISEPHVMKYVGLINAGKFLDGDDVPSIYLDDHGHIIDGQHRVEAIVRTGRSFWLPVVYKADVERVATFVDMNRKRGVVDRVHMLGRTDYQSFHHTVNSYIYADESGMRATSIQCRNFSEDPEVIIERWLRVKNVTLELLKEFDTRGNWTLRKSAPGLPIVLAVVVRAAFSQGGVDGDVLEFWKCFINAAHETDHPGARFPRFLRELVIEHASSVGQNDLYRKALFFVAQQALKDFVSRSKRSSKYNLPLRKVVDIHGDPALVLNRDNCINHYPLV